MSGRWMVNNHCHLAAKRSGLNPGWAFLYGVLSSGKMMDAWIDGWMDL